MRGQFSYVHNSVVHKILNDTNFDYFIGKYFKHSSIDLKTKVLLIMQPGLGLDLART